MIIQLVSLDTLQIDQAIQIQTKYIEPAHQGTLESHNYVKGIVKFFEDSAITEAMKGGNQQ